MKNIGKSAVNYFTGRDQRNEYFWLGFDSYGNKDQVKKSENKYLFFGVIIPNIVTATGIGLSIGFQSPEPLLLSTGSECFRNLYKIINKYNIEIMEGENKIKLCETALEIIDFHEKHGKKLEELSKKIKNKK